MLRQATRHVEERDLRVIQPEDIMAVLSSVPVPVGEQALGAVGGQEALHRVSVRVHDAQTGGHGWAGLTELQGVTIDFWGGPQLHLWPQAARPL